MIHTTNAQLSPDCRNAIPICADAPLPSHITIADGNGDINDFDPEVIKETGCLGKGSIASANIENNTVWYVFRAGADGQVGFNIESELVSVSNAEWDFAVYGPDVNCAEISSGTIEPIRCNYEANDPGDPRDMDETDDTGLGINPDNGDVGMEHLAQSKNTFDDWLEVREGEIYYILINNFSSNLNGEPERFSFTFTGSAVDADVGGETAIDCTFRDEFLGLDIDACVDAEDIVLSALRSPAGNDIANIVWSVDRGNGVEVIPGETEEELIIPAAIANSGRYFVTITTASGTPVTVEDDGGILVTFFEEPNFNQAATEATVVSNIAEGINSNTVEIIVDDATGRGSYEYAINPDPSIDISDPIALGNLEFQDSPIFNDLPPGTNTVVINDKNGCGTITEDFLIVGYPKFFTPNGDMYHPTWNVLGIETLNNASIFIFDRYGKFLKQIGEFGGWDGTFNGIPMPSSDYWFRLEYVEIESGVAINKVRKGHFTLKR